MASTDTQRAWSRWSAEKMEAVVRFLKCSEGSANGICQWIGSHEWWNETGVTQDPSDFDLSNRKEGVAIYKLDNSAGGVGLLWGEDQQVKFESLQCRSRYFNEEISCKPGAQGTGWVLGYEFGDNQWDGNNHTSRECRFICGWCVCLAHSQHSVSVWYCSYS